MQTLEILNKLKNKRRNEMTRNYDAIIKAKDDEIRRLNNLYADTIKDLGDALIEIEAMKEQNRELFLEIIELIKQIDEAIAKFEATDVNRREWYQKGFNEAMKPKTCEGCKQSWKPNNQTFHKYFCEYLKIPVHGGFYCNRYQQKDNQ